MLAKLKGDIKSVIYSEVTDEEIASDDKQCSLVASSDEIVQFVAVVSSVAP